MRDFAFDSGAFHQGVINVLRSVQLLTTTIYELCYQLEKYQMKRADVNVVGRHEVKRCNIQHTKLVGTHRCKSRAKDS